MSETFSLPGQSSDKKKSFDYGNKDLNKSSDTLDINYMYVKECGITVTHWLDIIRKSENEVITLVDALKNEQLKNVKADQTTHDLKKKLDSDDADDDDADLILSKFKDLNEKIRLLDNQKLEIEEKLDIFINGKDIRTFKDGKYTLMK